MNDLWLAALLDVIAALATALVAIRAEQGKVTPDQFLGAAGLAGLAALASATRHANIVDDVAAAGWTFTTGAHLYFWRRTARKGRR